jgi:hypothetical protein
MIDARLGIVIVNRSENAATARHSGKTTKIAAAAILMLHQEKGPRPFASEPFRNILVFKLGR